MNWITLIGFTAATCTTISFVPQVYRTLKTRDTKGISLIMYTVFTTGTALWLTYGLIVHDHPVAVANFVTLVLAMSILILKIRLG